MSKINFADKQLTPYENFITINWLYDYACQDYITLVCTHMQCILSGSCILL